jgi:hypothetical protein
MRASENSMAENLTVVPSSEINGTGGLGLKRIKFLSAACVLFLSLTGCASIFGGFDDPVGEVSLLGQLRRTNEGGRLFYYGAARNTGDAEVQNVKAVIDSYDAAGAFLGRSVTPVVVSVQEETIGDEGEEEVVTIIIINDSLEVDEKGDFQVLTTIPFGQAARADVTFTFTSAEFEDI